MASPSSSSSSSKRTQLVWKPAVKLNVKRLQTIDDYINSYFTAHLLRPQLPHLNKPAPTFCQFSSDAETSTGGRSESHRRPRTKRKTEAEKISELAKEMERMLSRAKSKRQTNDLLQLFKNTLSNFIVPEHPMDDIADSKSDVSLKRNTPPYHHHYQHHNRSQDLNESQLSEQNLFADHETSMTMTTTTTRCQIKEPKVSLMESSKTNILHRCYGKQSVKALPQIYKSRKKNNGFVSNCQKPPPLLKTKGQKLLKQQQQQKVPNKQMKTIYENDQFDKSKRLISSNCDDLDEITINNSSSASSVNTDKQSTINTQLSNDTIINDSNKNLFQDCSVSKMTGIRKQTLKLINGKNEDFTSKTECQQIIDLNIEQDNSIVQRLTSFWNKKLNTLGQTKSMTDQSSVSSSITSVFGEEYRNREINHNENDKLSTCEEIRSEENFNEFSSNSVKSELPNDRGDVSFNQHNSKSVEKVLDKNVGKECDRKNIPFFRNDTDLPDLKMGLMNELLRVLQKRDNRLSDNKTNNEAVTQNLNDPQQVVVNAELRSDSKTESHISVNINDTGDEDSDFDSDNYDDEVEDFVQQCDERTLDAIEKCLLDDINNEDNNKEIEDYLKEQTQHSVELNVHNNEEQESKNEYDIKDVDQENLVCNIESDITNLNEPKSVITNVNSIISNLKQLIRTIESIPEELKSVDMNFNSLPIPDKIKNKITTLIVPQDNEIVDNKLIVNSISPMNHLQMVVSPSEQKQLFQCSSSGKLIGYTKREGYIYVLYLPKMLTLPILENVKNPFQKILFPKRNEFFKMLKNRSVGHGMELIKNQTIDKYSNILNNSVRKEEDDKNKELNDKSKTSEKIQSLNENLQQTVKNVKKNVKIIDKGITELAKPTSTQSSIIYLTSQPSCAVATTLKASCDNCYVRQRNTFVFKPNVNPAEIYPCNNLSVDLTTNSKNKVKFEEPVFIENNSISNNNSVEELSDRSGTSSSPSNSNQQEEYDMFTINNTNVNNDANGFRIVSEIIPKESRVNFDESTPSLQSDINAFNKHLSNIRRRRYRLQNHTEDDTSILAGGSGDSMQNCGDVIMSAPIPCHNTSSMSVVVSNSINDSNSQTDININESELNLSRLRLYGHCSAISRTQSPQDSDNFSTCGVIQEEESDEQLSDIDDCVMIEEHTNNKENQKGSFGTRSSTTISSQNINLSNNQENKKGGLDLVLSSNSSQNINLSNNQEGQKNDIAIVSSSSIISQAVNLSNNLDGQKNVDTGLSSTSSILSGNINSSTNLDQDTSLVISQNLNVENKISDQNINEKTCDLKYSFLNLKSVSKRESTCNVLSICGDVNDLQVQALENNSGDEKDSNKKSCDNQFLYQNLKNMMNEETLNVSQSLSTNHIEDDKLKQRGTNEKRSNKKFEDKNLSYQNADAITNNMVTMIDEQAVMPRPELKLHSSSSVPGNAMKDCIVKDMALQNDDFSNELCSNSCDDIIESVSCDQGDKDGTRSNEEDAISIIKNEFHQNYHAYYFETEISNQAQLAVANRTMNNYKNDLELMLRKNEVLKSELSKIIDIDTLSDKEKYLIAACICLMNRSFYNKQPPSINVSVGNLCLNSSLTTLWNKTSKTMCNRIKLASRSLIPYDFQTDTLLYQRCYRRLLRSFYTLFITLVLIFVIQKHFCGILLPINFPW